MNTKPEIHPHEAIQVPRLSAATNWQRLDLWLFHALGGGQQSKPRRLALACAVARWSWLPLLVLVVAAAWAEGRHGGWLLAQCLAVAVGVQLVSKRLARHWHAPRPFVRGLSPNHLGHSARGGFPSTHAMVMGSVLGFMLLVLPAGHPLLIGMALTVTATGWARVCAGAHFPLDVLAGTALGLVCGALAAGGWVA